MMLIDKTTGMLIEEDITRENEWAFIRDVMIVYLGGETTIYFPKARYDKYAKKDD